ELRDIAAPQVPHCLGVVPVQYIALRERDRRFDDNSFQPDERTDLLEDSSWSNAEGGKIPSVGLKTDCRPLHVSSRPERVAIIKDGYLETRETGSHHVFQPFSMADGKEAEFCSVAEFGQVGLASVLKPSIIRELLERAGSLCVGTAAIEHQNE